MKEIFKKLIRKLLGWYVEPICQESTHLKEQLVLLESDLEQVKAEACRTQERVADIEGREQWTREQFEAQGQRITDIEGREQWTREQFEAQGQRITDIESREQWTREQFEAQDQRITDIEGREQWTREQFEAQDQRITDIEGREQWTRDRFEAQGLLLQELGHTLKNLEEKAATVIQEQESLDMQLHELHPTFSQSGEDAIAAYVLQFLQKPIEEITYLDLGANHAKELSNTYAFYCRGARGVLVEANPELIPELVQERPADIVLNRVITFEEKDFQDFYVMNGDGLSTINLEEAQEMCRKNPELHITGRYKIKAIHVAELLSTYFDEAPTILSIDLEGIEEKILAQIDYEKYAPTIIIFENIPYTPLLSAGEREYRCVQFLQQEGYVEYAFTGINSIFVLQKEIDKFNLKRQKELEEK